MSDESWAEYARASRDALGLLGYGITPRCLPGEPEACGATFAQHVMAHLATIKAVADHQLAHLGAPYVEHHGEIYWQQRHKLEADHGCQGVPS